MNGGYGLKKIGMLLALLLCAAGCARAELATESVDRQVERLNILSQHDEAIGSLPYYRGEVRGRGCQPVSIANGMIAAFGVTDRELAVGVARETLELLVPAHRRGKSRIDLDKLPALLDPEQRRQEAAQYPHLAQMIGEYGGSLQVTQENLDAQSVLDALGSAQGPRLLVGRMSVQPDWTEAVELAAALHGRGMDDVTLCLAGMGVGSTDSGMPLGSGKNGHYLTVMLHVGSFMRDGSVYVLDSIARAIEGEPFGWGEEMYRQYPFAEKNEKVTFKRDYQSARIAPTVIRLSLTDAALASLKAVPEGEETLEEHVRLMNHIPLFGRGVLLISLPDAA